MPDQIRRQLTKGYFSGRTVCDRDRKAGDNKRCFIFQSLVVSRWSLVVSCLSFDGAKIQQKKAEVKTSAKMIKKTNKMMQFLSVQWKYFRKSSVSDRERYPRFPAVGLCAQRRKDQRASSSKWEGQLGSPQRLRARRKTSSSGILFSLRIITYCL